MPAVLAFEMMRQGTQEFKASLSYIMNFMASLGYMRSSIDNIRRNTPLIKKAQIKAPKQTNNNNNKVKQEKANIPSERSCSGEADSSYEARISGQGRTMKTRWCLMA